MQTAVSQRCSQSAGSFVFFTRRLRAPCLCIRSLIFLFLSFFSLAAVAATEPFREAQFIAGLGANQLALQKIEQQQSRPELSADNWLRWERLRIELYSKTGAWKMLIQRIDEQQQRIPAVARDWFSSQQVSAWLALDNGQAARNVLRRMIWLRDTEPATESLLIWREQLIRSYLLDNQANAAHTAMLRHNQDYPAGLDDAQFLRAKVLLRAGRAKDAADLLEKSQSVQARSLYLLAALRSAKLSAKKVVNKAQAMIKAKGLDKDARLRLWAVIAEASRAENATGQYADALEQLFSETRSAQLDDGLIKLEAEALWQAYSQHAQVVGNRKQLLIGDDEQWFAQAKKNKNNPLRQRTLFGFLTESASNEQSRMRAHEGLVKSLQQREGGMEVLRRLYLHVPRFENQDKLPPIVRYTLLEQALNESDVSLASRLMQGLQAAPQGIEPLQWDMRRARVFVMAGDVSRGSEVLHAMLDSEAIFDKTATDRFMQVLFDLQTINEHDKAYELFEKLLKQTGDFQLQREILFWMADSRKAQNQYAEAAVLYLRSAELPDQVSLDLWAQSALYQAAEALTEANLISDARRIYSRLLSISKDEARRAVLQRRLQQLWLRESRGG
jgi:tetratricopeptide (TPR) repeat protein